MLAASREILQRILYQKHPNHFDDYLNHFEESERSALSNLEKIDTPLDIHSDTLADSFKEVHYSWFIPQLEKLPSHAASACLNLFSTKTQNKLKTHLDIKSPKHKCSPFLEKFLVQYLMKQIGFDQMPPKSFLPPAESLELLKLTKDQMVHLICYLGLYELANISKKVLDKEVFKQIDELLSPSQKKIFELAKKTSEPRSSSTTSIKKHLLDHKTFTVFLEQKGLLRLSKSFALEHCYFIWHFAHKLDSGRGQELLFKVRQALPNTFTSYYHKELLELLQNFKIKEPK